MWRAALVWLLSTSGVPAPETVDAALALEQRGDDAGASGALERLIGYRPTFALARLEAARIYLKTESGLTRAEGHLEAALALIPEEPRAHFLWALVMEGRGRPAEALKALNLSVRLRPEFAEAQARLGALYARRSEWPEAERHLRAWVQQEPQSIQARLQLAESLARQSRWEDVQDELRSALQRQPRSALLASRLAEACERVGRTQEATQLRQDPGAVGRRMRPLPKSSR
jgi:tetratricopeptide (TPR) repeat protein